MTTVVQKSSLSPFGRSQAGPRLGDRCLPAPRSGARQAQPSPVALSRTELAVSDSKADTYYDVKALIFLLSEIQIVLEWIKRKLNFILLQAKNIKSCVSIVLLVQNRF